MFIGSYNPYLSGFQYGLKKESREITLNKGWHALLLCMKSKT